MKYMWMTRATGFAVAILCCLACTAGARGVKEGQTRAEIVASVGPPERETKTARGSVMFFGRTLVEIENGVATYVSVTPGGAAPVKPKPVRVRFNIVGDTKAEEQHAPESKDKGVEKRPEKDELVANLGGARSDTATAGAGEAKFSGAGWSSFALKQNKLELVARLKRSLLMESYISLFRPDGTLSKPYEERRDLSVHDVRDKIGESMKCYGQDLEVRDPSLADLQTRSSLSRPEEP